jgi:hypothetical protein
MEQLKNIGQLCRQNYEKLILILVLVLLAVAVWLLFQASQSEKEKIRQIPIGFDRKTVKLVQPVRLDRFASVMKEATNPPALNFAGVHNLFNPVKWQQPRAGGEMVKVQTGKEVGAEAMQIVRVSPIFLTISFDRAAISGTPPDITVTGYHTVVTNELAMQPRLRRLHQFAALNATNIQVFVLREVKGPPEAPTELVAQLKDFGSETITFAPGKPYTRPVGYEVELKYAPSGKVYPRLRKDSPLDIEGEPYKIVDIAPNKVVLSDDSNGKRYTIDKMVAP